MKNNNNINQELKSKEKRKENYNDRVYEKSDSIYDFVDLFIKAIPFRKNRHGEMDVSTADPKPQAKRFDHSGNS